MPRPTLVSSLSNGLAASPLVFASGAVCSRAVCSRAVCGANSTVRSPCASPTAARCEKSTSAVRSHQPGRAYIIAEAPVARVVRGSRERTRSAAAAAAAECSEPRRQQGELLSSVCMSAP